MGTVIVDIDPGSTGRGVIRLITPDKLIEIARPP